MVDESKLENLEYDDENRLQYLLDDDGNLACGENGLEYTGIIQPRISGFEVCTPREDCDCGPIVRNVDGDIWAPPNPLFQYQTIINASSNANTILPPGGIWQSNTLSHTSGPTSTCVDTIAHFVTNWQILVTDNSSESQFSINTRNQFIGSNILNQNTSTPGSGLNVYTISGSDLQYANLPQGGTFVFNWYINVENLFENDSNIGIYGWRMYTRRYILRNLEPCSNIFLGGNQLL